LRNIIVIVLILFCIHCKPKDKSSQWESLAVLIIETGDNEQLSSLKNKLSTFQKEPSSVFKNNNYYYDTEILENQVPRGSSTDLKENTQWFLLIDNLSQGKYIREFDGKTSMDDIRWVIGQLAKRKKYKLPQFPSIQNEKEKAADELLSIINDTLKKSGLALINFDIQSDSYVIALIKKENLTDIVQKASETGNIILEY